MRIDREEKTITISQGTGVTTTVAFLLTAAVALTSGVTWVNATQNRLDGFSETIRGQRAEINQLKADSTATQLGLTEIKTQLKSIDASLIELKDRR